MKKSKLGMAHYPSGAYRTIQTQFNHFSEYVAHCRDLIEQARLDLENKDREKIIAANCPYELNGTTQSRKGILLIHGLYDSPCMMQSVGDYFAKQGFKVRSLLLPGHGTVPGDLLEVTYRDWIATVEYGLSSFKGSVDQLYIAGFSTGGTLAIYLGLLYPGLIHRLILFAPALRLISLLNYLARFPQQSHWILPHPKWLTIEEEIDYAKYSSFCMNSLHQTFQLGNIVRTMLEEKKLMVPSCWVVTKNDEVLNTNKLLKLFSQYTLEGSQMIFYSPNKKVFSHPRIEWRSSQRKEEDIMDFSHVSLPIAPDHPHYGKSGDFQALICRVLAKRNRVPKRYGALKNVTLTNSASLVRLTYNPDFEALFDSALDK